MSSSDSISGQRDRPTPPSRRTGNTGADAASGTGSRVGAAASSRRKACNECRQQKLRCEVSANTSDGEPQDVCRRCHRLGLDCKIDDGFQRTRKRRRSVDLEQEVRDLRKQLDDTRRASTIVAEPAMQDPSAMDWEMQAAAPTAISPHAPFDALAGQIGIPGPLSMTGSGAFLTAGSLDTNTSPSAQASRAPGFTTRPETDGEHILQRAPFASPRPRALGNTVLSVEEIEELFQIYYANYHQFLPLLDMIRSPHEHYMLSELLFWSVICVAARRLKSQPTLLPKLARSVTDLLWRTLRTVPHSVAFVQGLAILCTWPFPTSSSTKDPTFMLVGLMLQIGTQMGLHLVSHAEDFTKERVNLGPSDRAEWCKTWEYCNVVAQSVSVGCGVPIFLQPPDDAWSGGEPVALGGGAISRVGIERFKSRVSSSLAPRVQQVGSQAAATAVRLVTYRLLEAELAELGHASAGLDRWYVAAAKVHLHAFYLLDPASSTGYQERICLVYASAYSLIELSLELDTHPAGFLDHCPFFCYQVFVCASIIVLKIQSNSFFSTLLDVPAGTKLIETAIAALRKMSVMNNDLPARLGDVIGFFCALSDAAVIGGKVVEDVQLKQVRNRLSMSIVYDSLWTWRKQFAAMDSEEQTRENGYGFDDSGRMAQGMHDPNSAYSLDFSLESWDFML